MRLKVLLVAAVFAISFVGFYSAPAQAADGITPYANFTAWGGYVAKDKYASGFQKSDTDYAQMNFPTAATNMGVRGEKNGVKGWFEIGVRDGADVIRVRQAFASYTAPNGLGILFGQTASPWSLVDRSDVNQGDVMVPQGSCFDGWVNQIRLMGFGAYIQFMAPVVPAVVTVDNTPPAPTNPMLRIGYDATYPKVGAGYGLKIDPATLGFNAVFQQYKIDKQNSTAAYAEPLDGKKVTSYLFNVTFVGAFGPANVNAIAYYAQNPGNAGFYSMNSGPVGPAGNPTNPANTKAVLTAAGVEDTTVYGGRLGAGYKVGDIQINVGLAYEKAENDLMGTEKKDDFLVYYANVMYFIQPNLFIAPEVKIVDLRKDKNDVDEGKTSYYGIAFVASI